MSRKKNLSLTASLATCLDFAARVLSSTATVLEVCTKPVLAPMVVEAHRYGLQVMKHIDFDSPADTRKLLKFLQEEQNGLLRRDSPLIDLNVADLTWDFEGTVVDTLKMELEELQERAATSTTDTCVVFSASSSAVGDGQAVIWFPQEQHEDSSPITSKKRQILLYVCPGRVKVVKSVGDLIKKMYNELPMLRERGATYNVWAVVVGSSFGNQQGEKSRNMEFRLSNGDEIGQYPPESCSECLVVTNSLATPIEVNEQKRSKLKLSELSTGLSNQDAPELVNPLDTALESPSDGVDQNDLSPVSPRASIYHDATEVKKNYPASIFSFGLRGSANVQTKLIDEECEDEKETNDNTSTKIAEVEGSSPVDIQRLESWPKRDVSVSLADLSIPSVIPDKMECVLGLGVHMKGDFAWQSCDGKVLRRSVRPQQKPKSVEVELKESGGITLPEESRYEDDAHAASHDAVHAHDETIAGVADRSPVDNQRLESWPKREILSVSLANVSIPSEVPDDIECVLGLGCRLKGNFAWQSCDGKVLRRSVHPQQMSKSDEVEVKVSSGVALSEESIDDAHATSHDAVRVHDVADVEEDKCEEIQQEKSKVFRSDDLQKQQHSTALLPYQAVNELRMSRDNVASYSLFTFGRISSMNKVVDKFQASVDLSSPVNTSLPTAYSVNASNHVEIVDCPENVSSNHSDMMESLTENSQAITQDEEPVVNVDGEASGRSDLAMGSKTILPTLKPKPVPVNYKDKLGARIWWELEYTATRLEREAMIERHQKARRRQGNNAVKENSRIGFLKPVRLDGPQRREPTGWSKNAGRPVRPTEVRVVSEQYICENEQEPLRACIITSEPDNPNAQKLGDKMNIAVSPSPVVRNVLPTDSYNRRDSETKVSTGKSFSPSVVQNSEVVSSHDEVSECTECCRLSSGEAHSRTRKMTAEEEVHTRKELTIDYPDPIASASKPHERVSDTSPGNLKATLSKPDNESSKSSTVYPCEPEAMVSNLKTTLSKPDNESSKSSAVNPHESETMVSNLKATFSKPAINSESSKSQAVTSHEPERMVSDLKATFSKPLINNESLKSLVANPHERMASNNQAEDEDETLTQMMWGSTHTSYERNHNLNLRPAPRGEEEVRATEVVATPPFTVHGRVPIRTRQASSTVAISAPDDRHEDFSSCSGAEHTPFPDDSPRNYTRSTRKADDRVKPSRLHRASPRLQDVPSIPAPPHAATFIALGEDTPAHSSSAGTRQERLNELRQKKLRKLQQTRDMSIQQQKEKQYQREAHRPLSFASSVYSKKASNRQLMQNALEFTLLAGGSMEKERTLALLALTQSTCDNFIVLLKSAKELKFRALYENHVERDCATRIFSVLPSNSARAPVKLGNSEVISQFFKYSSAKKQFLPVSTRSFTVKTDACALVDQHMFKGKPKTSSSALSRLL